MLYNLLNNVIWVLCLLLFCKSEDPNNRARSQNLIDNGFVDDNANETEERSKPKVRFNKVVQVFIVPSIIEYKDLLWWNRQDYNEFKLGYKQYIDVPVTKQNKCKVSFCNQVYVILVPARRDYQEYRLNKSIWWSKHELTDFKNDAEKNNEYSLNDKVCGL